MSPSLAPSVVAEESNIDGWRRAAAEGLGTGALVCTVVGSGIMGESLSPDNLAVALLVNAIATVFALFVLITIFSPVSGAHFNPVVTLTERFEGSLSTLRTGIHIGSQVLGAIGGAAIAHLMFDHAAVEWSGRARDSAPEYLGEIVATAGLLFVIQSLARSGRAAIIPVAVAAYIGAAYFFTSSTSFANPAVTLGRTITDTFSGISPADAPMFIAMQCIGAALGHLSARAIFPDTD